jgi:hypothetical protein
MKIQASLACCTLIASVLLLAACGPDPTRTPAMIVLATVTKTMVPSPTPTVTTTATPTLASTPALTQASTATPTGTPALASTATPALASTATPALTSTATPISTAVHTPAPTFTATPTKTPTSAPSATPAPTQAPTPTATQKPPPTSTASPVLSNDLIGTWSTESGIYWQFREDGTYCLGGAPPALCQDPLSTGIFWLDRTQLVIRDTGGRSVCGPGSGEPEWDGVYLLFLIPNETFSLMLVYDPCLSRTEIVTRSTWVSQ